ncbi:GerAB/ArcD/ProY family transporter [Clostridium sp. C8-1-8]|uniref:GerAB/ArcD/ProY family transporter n=1 Tax=Clostridium sp. C8-1-8 TaxID=2698831 RepID=UPI0013712BA9|nr:GerAB/ArcD/ProY family transporter [Clostridium sp. C8-1-8]
MNNKISGRQLVRMMILFQIGSAVAIPLATSAKQDSWIVIFLGMVIGTGATFIYSTIFNKSNGGNFTEILKEILGGKVGFFLSLIYIFYYIYIANRIINDFRIIIRSTALQKTPDIMVILIMTIPAIYCAYLGIEAMGRGAVILNAITFTTIILITLFAFLNKLPKMERLLPVLEYGWEPIIKLLFPLAITVPYGETITFLNIYPNVLESEINKVRKLSFISNIIAGNALAFASIMSIATISATIVEISVFPILKSIGVIQIGTFIQRLDVFAILLLMLGGFYKILIFFYCSVEMTMTTFKLDNRYRNLVVITLGIIVVFISYMLKSNPVQHFHVGLDIVPIYIHVPLQFVVPIFLLIIVLRRNKNRANIQ